jgi:hemerythrin-like domain-containing protein
MHNGGDPIEVLVNEHRSIERVLDAIEARLQASAQGPFPADFFSEALDFLSNFADGCHHYKEEQCLFPMLTSRGMPREGGPVGMMLHEHDEGRGYLAAIRQNLEQARAGSPEAIEAVRENAEAYIHLLRQHIFKENNVLFQMARNLLSSADMQKLSEQYEGVEREKGAGVHERYQTLAAKIA